MHWVGNETVVLIEAILGPRIVAVALAGTIAKLPILQLGGGNCLEIEVLDYLCLLSLVLALSLFRA